MSEEYPLTSDYFEPVIQEDIRNIACGRPIETDRYADQPYIIKTDDGAWLLTVTTAEGEEGASGEYVKSMRSTDRGKTWGDFNGLEKDTSRESAYSVLLKTSFGRIYCFYNHNTDNIREAKADNPPFKTGFCKRVDCLGHYVFRYSDDHGKTWSEKRYEVPVREFLIDRNNPYGGEIRYFWNVGKPSVYENIMYLPFIKVGRYGVDFYVESQGAIIKSDNIMTERNPEKIRFETLPEGEIGLTTPEGGGSVSEEQSIAILSDGTIYCVYRSIDGHPVCAYSYDGGRTFTPPEYKKYANGRMFKHPRAANFVWRCENGKLLYWYHNHGGRNYEDRNPVWISGGIEKETPQGRIIEWSQPEALLYDDNIYVKMSYPDLVEEEGEYYFSETQKNVGRIHHVDKSLLEGLWAQLEGGATCTKMPKLSWRAGMDNRPAMPLLNSFLTKDRSDPTYKAKKLRTGFTLTMRFNPKRMKKNALLFSSMTDGGRGIEVRLTENESVLLTVGDGQSISSFESDRKVFSDDKSFHLGVVVDGGPNIIIFVIDGVVCDGGKDRQFGWGRFSPDLRHVNGKKNAYINDCMEELALYGEQLRTSEIIALKNI